MLHLQTQKPLYRYVYTRTMRWYLRHSTIQVIVLEEAAYCDPGFFYETVAPLLLIGRTSLLCISTLTGSYNFYTRLFKQIDPTSGRPMFYQIQVQLACPKCIDDGHPEACVHMLHLVPEWQSSTRHTRLKTIMQDRPDLIQSELAGLAFDAQQSIFRPGDIETMFSQSAYPNVVSEDIFIVIDPAAGGPHSDYAFVSFTRLRGSVRVIGAEVLSGCKEPEKQFDLVADHIRRLRRASSDWVSSRVIIYVERNLGHEAEHHRHALKDLAGVYFREDPKNGRVGLLTTNEIKHGMATLLNIMLREERLCILSPTKLVCRDGPDFVLRLREQLGVYSYQFKDASDTFGKQRVALTGKVGGMKDDIVIALQLGIFFTDWDAKYGLYVNGAGSDLHTFNHSNNVH